MTTQTSLSPDHLNELLETLRLRFISHQDRHPTVEWTLIEALIRSDTAIQNKISAMEESHGEPDVVSDLTADLKLIYVDCALESPKGRRSYCYDQQALLSRKENKPQDSAIASAEKMGITILNETQYYALQDRFPFDQKSASWILTEESVRKQGGALFCERRFGRVFTAANGADSYFGNRGYRAYIVL